MQKPIEVFYATREGHTKRIAEHVAASLRSRGLDVHIQNLHGNTVEDLNFFVRKALLFKYSHAFIIMPGGLGTSDELFEALTLIQNGKISHFPIIIFGKEYWRDVAELMNKMVEAGAASPADLELLYFTDSIDEMMEVIWTRVIKAFGFRLGRKRPWRILGEQALELHH